jgi:hypothetical protein
MTAMYKFCWALWIVGTILIAASWADLVTPTLGWVGFGIALVGSLLSFGAQRPPQQSWPNPPEVGVEDQSPDAGPKAGEDWQRD